MGDSYSSSTRCVMHQADLPLCFLPMKSPKRSTVKAPETGLECDCSNKSPNCERRKRQWYFTKFQTSLCLEGSKRESKLLFPLFGLAYEECPFFQICGQEIGIICHSKFCEEL